MNVSVEKLKRLYVQKLSGLYGGELEQLTMLPEMAKAARAPVLAILFQSQIEKTHEQLERLDRIFARLGLRPTDFSGLEVEEAALDTRRLRAMLAKLSSDDLTLIATAQAIKQHEISGYLLTLNSVQILRDYFASELLEETLNEEYATHRSLAELGAVLEGARHMAGGQAALAEQAATVTSLPAGVRFEGGPLRLAGE